MLATHSYIYIYIYIMIMIIIIIIIYIYIYIVVYVSPGPQEVTRPRGTWLRGWQNAVEIVLFEISSSMKPYPSVFHACTGNLRLAKGFAWASESRRGFQPYSANLSLAARCRGRPRSGFSRDCRTPTEYCLTPTEYSEAVGFHADCLTVSRPTAARPR